MNLKLKIIEIEGQLEHAEEVLEDAKEFYERARQAAVAADWVLYSARIQKEKAESRAARVRRRLAHTREDLREEESANAHS